MSRRLIARGLNKSYSKRQVVKNVDLDIDAGQVVGLLGPNGAGKTTSFYMVVGLVQPDSGQVFLDDAELTGTPMCDPESSLLSARNTHLRRRILRCHQVRARIRLSSAHAAPAVRRLVSNFHQLRSSRSSGSRWYRDPSTHPPSRRQRR